MTQSILKNLKTNFKLNLDCKGEGRMEDIEIARNTKLENITKIADKVGIKEDELELYGKYKAKISSSVYKRLHNKKDGKLILVTAINPTPLGEGKTTIAIGLADGLNRLNKNAVLALREPSLGPVLELKVELLVEDMLKLLQWLILICILLVIYMQLQLLIIC